MKRTSNIKVMVSIDNMFSMVSCGDILDGLWTESMFDERDGMSVRSERSGSQHARETGRIIVRS